MNGPFRIASAAFVTTFSLIGSACGGSDAPPRGAAKPAPDEATTTTRPRYSPGFVEGTCPVPVDPPLVATCGTLTVPENRSKPEGRRVELAVVRIHSLSETPKPDPVVYLHGGPGSGRLRRGFATVATNPALAQRDIIYFDQRGVGLSTPSLNCPERETAFIAALSSAAPYADEVQLFSDALGACHKRLVDEGVELSQYNTRTNAEDLADLRVAMGYDEWNLWGISYGTRLALETMRSHPNGVRSVVIDSVYPPSAGSAEDSVRSGRRSFEALSNGCATDPACNAANPDVNGALERAATALDADPYGFDYTAADGTALHFVLTGNDAVGGLFNAMYDTDLIPILPTAITGLANGDRSIIPTIADQGIPFINDATEGAFLSYECADNAERLDRASVKKLRLDAGRAGLLMLASWQLFCDQWPVEHLPKSFGNVVHSDIPTLVIAGEYDPITPPADSKGVADALDDAVFVQAPHGGHGPGLDFECTKQIYRDFFERLTAVDTACAASMTPAPFG